MLDEALNMSEKPNIARFRTVSAGAFLSGIKLGGILASIFGGRDGPAAGVAGELEHEMFVAVLRPSHGVGLV
jgi:hypothetical protein